VKLAQGRQKSREKIGPVQKALPADRTRKVVEIQKYLKDWGKKKALVGGGKGRQLLTKNAVLLKRRQRGGGREERDTWCKGGGAASLRWSRIKMAEDRTDSGRRTRTRNIARAMKALGFEARRTLQIGKGPLSMGRGETLVRL